MDRTAQTKQRRLPLLLWPAADGRAARNHTTRHKLGDPLPQKATWFAFRSRTAGDVDWKSASQKDTSPTKDGSVSTTANSEAGNGPRRGHKRCKGGTKEAPRPNCGKTRKMPPQQIPPARGPEVATLRPFRWGVSGKSAGGRTSPPRGHCRICIERNTLVFPCGVFVGRGCFGDPCNQF